MLLFIAYPIWALVMLTPSPYTVKTYILAFSKTCCVCDNLDYTMIAVWTAMSVSRSNI